MVRRADLGITVLTLLYDIIHKWRHSFVWQQFLCISELCNISTKSASDKSAAGAFKNEFGHFISKKISFSLLFLNTRKYNTSTNTIFFLANFTNLAQIHDWKKTFLHNGICSQLFEIGDHLLTHVISNVSNKTSYFKNYLLRIRKLLDSFTSVQPNLFIFLNRILFQIYFLPKFRLSDCFMKKGYKYNL